MPDSLRRALRGLFQVGFIQAVLNFYNAFWEPDLNNEQYTALTVVLTFVFAFAQNWLEDNVSWIPAFGKSPASVGANPVPDTTRKLEPH